MFTVNLNQIDLHETWGEHDPTLRCRSAFPFAGPLGTENATVVYFELEPGDYLGRHTDSAEEILLILDGTVDVTVNEEQGRLSRGEMALVPTMAPHSVRNVGREKARVVGFFGRPNIVATFEKMWLPNQSHVVDTAAIFAQALA
jgi:quercetin dioxygenase-like cupin family protein